MKDTLRDTYKGWSLSVQAERNMCSNFSFDITDPAGRTRHVAMGGDSRERAVERAREMIDMEISMADEE